MLREQILHGDVFQDAESLSRDLSTGEGSIYLHLVELVTFHRNWVVGPPTCDPKPIFGDGCQ